MTFPCRHYQPHKTCDHHVPVFRDIRFIHSEIQNRCNKTYQTLGQMTHIFKNKNVKIDTKVALYKTIIIPSLCYQCQTWTMTAQDKREIVTAKMTCLRRILGVSLSDRIRNDSIRQITKTIPVLEHIKRQQIKWFSHASRLPTDSIPQMAMTHRHNSYKARGRPYKRWITEIKLQEQAY